MTRYLFACLLLLGTTGHTAPIPCSLGVVSAPNLRGVPLERRIHRAPTAIAKLALWRNLANGVAVQPRTAHADHPLIPVLLRMLDRLPPLLRDLAEAHVAAIYLVQGNFGSARVEAAWDVNGRVIGGCILLNLDALSRTANSWASWREGSAFSADEHFRIALTLEPPQTNTVENALRFVFIHELGHILGMTKGVHGFWAAPETWSITAQSPYTRLSWSAGDGRWRSPDKQRFPILALPRFYRFGASPLPLRAAPLVYRTLGKTNWSSLYGSIDPYEDLAETFAIHVHTQLLGRPYRVQVFRGAVQVAEYLSCLDTGTCPRKRAFIEKLLMKIEP